MDPPKDEKNTIPNKLLLMNIMDKKPSDKIKQKPDDNPSIPSIQFIALVMETIHIAENKQLTKGESITLISPKNGKYKLKFGKDMP